MDVVVNTELCAGKRISRSKDEVEILFHYARRPLKIHTVNAIKVLAKKKGQADYSFEDFVKKRKIDDTVSYGGKDACQGDSGGPLWRWVGRTKVPHSFS